MNTDLSFSVLTSNIISLLLVFTLYFSNKRRMGHGRDMKYILHMMFVTAISNVADCCVYYVDGSSGIFLKILAFLCGSWLFFANVLVGYSWLKFLITHFNIQVSETREGIYRGGAFIACILLIVNIFYPLVFSINDGTYHRGPMYYLFLVFAILYIIDSLYLYTKCRKKVGTLKLFPVQVFLVPIVIGVTVQAFYIEVSITWPSVAIAIAGVMTALKNEVIFMDRLTGLYNRVYLEFLREEAHKMKDDLVSGIMVDLNGFKQINDNYGHSEGDEALIIVADLLRKSFSEYGVVTRYAGDEFVVILNTTDENFIKELISHSKNIFDNENKTNNKPYDLSASMGYAITDLKTETVDDFMNRIDQNMYKDKLEYYKANKLTKR